MYAILKLTYRAEWQGKPITVYVCLLLLYTTMLSAILIGMWRQEHLRQIQTTRMSQRMLVVISLIATVVTVCASPFFPLSMARPGTTEPPLTIPAWSPISSTSLVWGKLLAWGLLSLPLITVPIMFLLSLKLSLGGVSSADILKTSGLLLMLAVLILTLALFCSVLFHQLHTATGVTGLIIICLLCGTLMAGPLISRLSAPEYLIHAVLLANPIIGMSSTIGFDILRTEVIYTISPLAQRPFVYPSWGLVTMCYLLASLTLAFGTVWRVTHLRQCFDSWRHPS